MRALEAPVNPRSALTFATVVALAANLTACELAKGIFKAGVWVGVLGVVGLVVLVGLAFGALRK